jgi:hypothetical protein
MRRREDAFFDLAVQLPEAHSPDLAQLSRRVADHLAPDGAYENHDHFVGGTSSGDGTCEIWITTVDPVRCFEEIEPLLSSAGLDTDMAVAQRKRPDGDWHLLHPLDDPGRFVSPDARPVTYDDFGDEEDLVGQEPLEPGELWEVDGNPGSATAIEPDASVSPLEFVFAGVAVILILWFVLSHVR